MEENIRNTIAAENRVVYDLLISMAKEAENTDIGLLVSKNGLYSSRMAQQLRCVFTTLCLLENIDADTSRCDALINEIHSIFYQIRNSIKYDEVKTLLLSYIA